MLKARLWIRQEAAVWSGRGGRHPKPLQIHVPAHRAGEDMWWRREPWGTFLTLHEEATGTRGHLIAGPGSRGDGFLASLWTSKRGTDLASCGDMPLRTTLRWGGDGSFLPRNIHPDHLSENPSVSRMPCLQRVRRQGTCYLSSGNTNQFIPLCVFNVLQRSKREKNNRKLNGEWLGWEKGLGWGREGFWGESCLGTKASSASFQILLNQPSMSFRKTSDEPLAWMLDHADPREKADRNFVSFISKNTFLSIQQLPYCNLSSHQSSRH